MSRSLWKGPIVGGELKHLSRSSTILPMHLNKTFEIHNGIKFVKVTVTPKMIGHKFGKYSLTKIKTINNKHGTKN